VSAGPSSRHGAGAPPRRRAGNPFRRGAGRRPARASAPDPEAVAVLEEQRSFLLDSLRDLEREREAGDIDEVDYDTLRDDYTARAAGVLRALEAARTPTRRPRRARPGPARPAADPPPRNRGRVIAVVVILVVAGAAGLAVATFSGQRVTGQGSSGPPASETARHLTKAQQLDTQGKAVDALKEYDAAIKADGTNVVALTYRGWLLARAGLTDVAMTSLDQALAVNRNYPDAHFFRGMVLYQGRHDAAGAVTEFETFLASNPPPEAAAAVQQVLDKARQDLAKAGPSPG
jgi:tetratricopeptide (TPR) repeat protein